MAAIESTRRQRMLGEYRWRFVPRAAACPEARRALEPFEEELGIADVRLLQLLVSELVANSVTHAGLGGRGLIELELLITDERISVTVSDHGRGFDPGPLPQDPARERSRGLQIIDGMTDRWGVLCNGRTRVWFEIDRTGA